jgi:NADPH2:quinone reductase
MRAVVQRELGPPDVLAVEDWPAPEPGAGEVLIHVEVANITFVETPLRAGHAPNPFMLRPLPYVPGNGVGGTVRTAGAGVDQALVGMRARIDEDVAATRRVTVVRGTGLTAAESTELTRTALALAAAGRLRPVIGQSFPLERAADAHAAMESRGTLGKTLLLVAG